MSDKDDPKNWPIYSADAVCVGLDIGVHSDNSFLTVGGAWSIAGRSVVGIIDSKQFSLNTPLEEVADFTASVSNNLPSKNLKVCFDGSNNSAFSGVIAARFGDKPFNHLVNCTVTNAHEHAAQPQMMQISLHGQRSIIPRWSVSKRALVEETAAEIEGGTLKFAQVGDWETIRDQFGTLTRTVRQSGAVTYAASQGSHDDGPASVALTVFGLRYACGVGQRRRTVARRRAPQISSLAWT